MYRYYFSALRIASVVWKDVDVPARCSGPDGLSAQRIGVKQFAHAVLRADPEATAIGPERAPRPSALTSHGSAGVDAD